MALSKGSRFRNIQLILKIISEFGVFPLRVLGNYKLFWTIMWYGGCYGNCINTWNMQSLSPHQMMLPFGYANLLICFFFFLNMSFFFFSQIHAPYAFNLRNLILKWLILMKCIRWLGTKDSGRNTTWKNNQFKNTCIVFIWYFCGSTKMWKEANEEKLNSWTEITFILQL